MQPNVDEKSKHRVTLNFKSTDLMFPDAKAFREYREEHKNDMLYDKRNGIWCICPTQNFEMYLNYLNYLNGNYREWQSFGYFDMGMVPYIMWPSFMESTIALELMKQLAKQAGVTLIQVYGTSFLKPTYAVNGADYWMFREDMVTLARFIENKFGKSVNIHTPEDAKLTEIVKVLDMIDKGI